MKKRLCMMGIMIVLLVFAASVVCAQSEEPSEQLTPSPAPEQPAPYYRNFSTGDRLATWALNYFVLPGLGSYVIMQDVVGGTVQLLVGGIGTGLGIATIVIFYRAYFQVIDNMDSSSFSSGDRDPTKPLYDALDKCLGLLIASAVLGTANGIFNIVRSATYDKPQPKVGSLADPNAWSIAILPGKDGIEQVQLAYTLRY